MSLNKNIDRGRYNKIVNRFKKSVPEIEQLLFHGNVPSIVAREKMIGLIQTDDRLKRKKTIKERLKGLFRL